MENYEELKRKAELNEYLRSGKLSEYGKDISNEALTDIYSMEAQNKINENSEKNIIKNNVKSENDRPLVYRPQEKRVSKRKMKSDILLLAKRIIAILVSLGVVVGMGIAIKFANDTLEERGISNNAEKSISTVMAGRSDGKNSDRGEHWYEEKRFVNAIIDKNSYDNPETLYVQLARIYTGLEDQTSESTQKLNDEYGNGYTPEEWIEKIYEALREKVLTQYGKEIGPEELMDFLNSIGKLPYDRNPYEVMLEYYDKYKTAIENQVRVNPNYVVLLPAEEVLEAEFGVVLD